MNPLKRPYLMLTLSLIWMALSNSYDLDSFVAGLIVAALVLTLLGGPVLHLSRVNFGGPLGFVRWVGRTLYLMLYFLWQVVLSTVSVAKLVLSRQPAVHPGILKMELKANSPGQIAVLAGMITLTPGTNTIGHSAEANLLYVHTIDATDPEEVLRVPRRFEAMLMEVIQ